MKNIELVKAELAEVENDIKNEEHIHELEMEPLIDRKEKLELWIKENK